MVEPRHIRRQPPGQVRRLAPCPQLRARGRHGYMVTVKMPEAERVTVNVPAVLLTLPPKSR